MILIVTPDNDKAEAIVALLEQNSIQARRALNGLDALDQLDRRSRPEAIVYDHSCIRLTPKLTMPEFRQRITRYYPGLLPIIMFDDREWHGNSAHGGEEYLVYPFSNDRISKALEALRLLCEQ